MSALHEERGAAARPPLALVAEDETIVRMDLCGILEAAGYDTVEARDGVEAVALARTQKPDVVLIDVKMPNLNGIDAAREILAEQILPVVVLTAYSDEETVERAIDAGIFGYLVKPFREQDVMPVIKTARARHDELLSVIDDFDALSGSLGAQKTIEHAKALLMASEGLKEREALARLRTASTLSGRPLENIAEAIIAAFSKK